MTLCYNEVMVKKKTFKDFYKDFLNKNVKLETYQKVGILLLVIVISGFVGWMYEFLLALIENGKIYAQGGNLLPWMNIYAIGAVVLIPITWKIRRYPWLVFLVSTLVTGVVELIGGWLVYEIGNGTRYWNYDSGPWAVGSINGFVCPLSATIFGLSALVLVYFLLPALTYLAKKMSKRAFLTLAITLFALVMIDEITNLTLKNLDLPTAMDFYRSLGLEY